MTMWPELEPLLAEVQKPARYIGGELGAITPEHGPGRVAWLLCYPDAYEVGLPNQGLQILYEILNERAGRGRRADLRPVDRPRGPPPGEGPAPVLGGQPPPGHRLRRAGVQPVRGARLHQRPQLHRPGRRTGPVGRADRCPPHRRLRRALRLQPRATGRLRRRLRTRRRRRGRGRDDRGHRRVDRRPPDGGLPPGLPAGPGQRHRRLRADVLRAGLRRCRPRRHPADRARRPGAGREADHRRPGRVAVPQEPARPPHGGRPRPPERRGLPGLHPGLSLLPGRDDHPTGPRAAGRSGPFDDPVRPPAHRATTRWRSPPCPPPTTAASRTR